MQKDAKLSGLDVNQCDNFQSGKKTVQHFPTELLQADTCQKRSNIFRLNFSM
jgi:hypothetical protein